MSLWLTFSLNQWPQNWIILVEFSPFILGAIALFVSLWLNRIRPFLVVLSIVLANLAFAYYAPVSQESVARSILYPLMSVFLPLNLFLWTLLPEKGVNNRGYNGFVFVTLSAQLMLLYWFMQELPLQLTEEISRPIAPDLDYINLPFMSAFVFLVAGFAISLKLQKQRQIKVFDHSVLFILLLMGFALNQYNHIGVFQLISMSSILIVLLALVFDAHHIAYTDELTGLKNRRALNEYMISLGHKYVIVMVDIDYFKQFNDSYGHDLGDEVLRLVAAVLNDVKAGGRCFRFGGEEFTLVFKYKQLDQVKDELERLRQAVEAETVEVILANKNQDTAKATTKAKIGGQKALSKKLGKTLKSKTVNVTISLGAAQATKTKGFGSKIRANEVLKLADQSLYKAKKTGRNRLVFEQTVT